MKKFTKIEPSETIKVGGRYKREVVIKRFADEADLEHEFTTYGSEKKRSGAVIAVTTQGQIVTTYQFRAGPEKWMYDLPGGGIEDDEEPQEGVLRELEEETGYIPGGEVIYLGQKSGDAYTNGQWYYYLAFDCAEKVDSKLADPEELEQGAEVRLISIEDVLHNATHDLMTDPVAVLMAYEKLREIQRVKK